MTEQQEISRLVTVIFRAWRQAQIGFLVLRNYEELPHFTTNDIDVLVAPEQLGRAERTLLAAAREAEFRLCNRAKFATLAMYFSSCLSTAQCHFDLFTALKWRGFDFLRCEGFLKRKIQRGDFFIPHPADEAATNLLASMIYTGEVKEKYKSSIAAGFRAEPEESKKLLAANYGEAQAAFLVEAASQEKWAEIESRIGALRRALVLRQLSTQPWRTVKCFMADGGRIAKRLLHPPGLSVVLCGADGSGKSTAAKAVIESLSGTFSPLKGRQYHWKPPVFSGRRQAARAPSANPHGQTARSALGSCLYLGFHWLEFFLGSFLRIRPITFRGGLVLIDRYYYDFFVDQRRYRLQAPEALVRWGYNCLKKPDVVVLLDAPAEVLHARKQEVPLAETERQRSAYRSLLERLPNGLIVNADQPPDKVARDIAKGLLEFMAARSKNRMR